ncbi:MAG: hypothetical protein NTZ05_15670 [Chloroflexi bacterium]|nr:hypothetical protein [Chloroflexota bacterium]
MYYKVTEGRGIVRVVESHTDEMREAAFYGALGLLSVKLAYDAFSGPSGPTSGISHGMWLGASFGGIFLLSLGFSSGIGRFMRGWVSGRVIEVDLKNQRFRRFKRRMLIKKDGGEWQPMGGAPKGAKDVQRGAKLQVAIRVGEGERTFAFVSDPGELDDDTLFRYIAAINLQLAANGVESREIEASREPRPRTLKLKWRRAWELMAAPFLALLFVAFLYGSLILGALMERSKS